MEDGAPVHRCRAAKEWKAQRGMQVLPWPAQSPDSNPIENLWMIMKRRVQALRARGRRPRDLEEYKACLQGVWDELQPQNWNKLIASMPSRLKEVIKNEGGPTHH